MATSRDDMEKQDLTFRRFKDGEHKYSRVGDDIFE